MEKTNKYHSHYIRNLLMPCIVFSTITGIVSTLVVTLFKIASSHIVELSENIYASVRLTPAFLPLLLLGSIVLGFLASLIISFSHSCRGGGIPTSIAAIRGIVNFNWIKSIFFLPISALITFLVGVPLGTEGPCVQIGTAIGDGTIQVTGGKKFKGWRRYIMVGGAATGFSLATGSPITAILFSMEELHKTFSPLLFSVVSISVIISQLIAHFLSGLGFGTMDLFEINALDPLPLSQIYVPVIVGFLCGICAIFFIKLYNFLDGFIKKYLKQISVKFKLPIIFALVALVGFFFSQILGSGHHLINLLFSKDFLETEQFWYILISCFAIRVIVMMVSNTVGVTGGIFLPTLAFGAILGAICAKAFIMLGMIDEKYYALLIVVGMVSFLGASTRIPVTACIFAFEALGGFYNILPLTAAVTVAFILVEVSGLSDFTSTVIHARAREIHQGKTAHVIEVPLTVYKGSFVIDKDIRDILWPASCTMLSIERGPNKTNKLGISEGDILTVYYTTYDPIATANEFEILVGNQTEEIDKIMRPE